MHAQLTTKVNDAGRISSFSARFLWGFWNLAASRVPRPRSLLVAVVPSRRPAGQTADRRVWGRSAAVLTIKPRVFCERSPSLQRFECARVACRRFA